MCVQDKTCMFIFYITSKGSLSTEKQKNCKSTILPHKILNE